MGIDLSSIGETGEPGEREWTSKDSLLYSLAVGVGSDDPSLGLEFTTENSTGVAQRALPSLIGVLSAGTLPPYGDVDRGKLLHAEQGFELYKPVPVEGRLRAQSRILSIWDKRSGALLSYQTEFTDLGDEAPLGVVTRSIFIRGEGGFGGPAQPADDWEAPTGKPDHSVTYHTRPDQALLYRLTGDRNPLHSDPSFAARSGFARPILHGMCTYGFAGRALLAAVAGGDPDKFRSMAGRFVRPVMPGDSLTTLIWIDGSAARFRTIDGDGTVVIDGGRMTLR